MKLVKKILPLCIAISFSLNLATANTLKFEAAEHQDAGDLIYLHDINGNKYLAKNYLLPMPNQLQISFGSEIALAGDHFGVPSEPIAFGRNPGYQKIRFLNAYESLANNPKAVDRAKKIIEMTAFERSELEKGIKEGKSPHDIYEKISPLSTLISLLVDHEKLFDVFYIELALTDFDHFTPENEIAFATGYRVALATAQDAYYEWRNSDDVAAEKLLKQAYAQLGFAAHFLTDRYAAGHMRTPRLALHNQFGFPGDVLSSFQHKEENNFGLEVADAQGHVWHAYGDAWYFEEVNKTHRQHIQDSMQKLADSIYFVAKGKSPIVNPDDLSSILVTPIANNISPMFKVENNRVFRRKDLTNPQGKEYLSDWNSWWTLAALLWQHYPKSVNGNATELQNELTGVIPHHLNDSVPLNMYPRLDMLDLAKKEILLNR